MSIVKGLFEAAQKGNRLDYRLLAMKNLVSLYGGNLDVASWILYHLDRTSNNDDTISYWESHQLDSLGDEGNSAEGRTEQQRQSKRFRNRTNGVKMNTNGCNQKTEDVLSSFMYCESPLFKYKLLAFHTSYEH